MDNYDLVLEYLLSEGYSHKEATSIMVNEGWFQDLLGAAKKRFSSPKSIARAGAADVAATAIATTPTQSARPALPPQPAPIVRQVAAAVKPNPLQQVAAPFKKVRNIVRQLNPAKPTAGSLPQGKPGGSVVPASKPGAVTPSAKPASGITNTSGGSSVATTTGSGQVSATGANVRATGGPLTKAGPVIDVKPSLSGTPEVKRIPPNKVRSFKPSVKVTAKPQPIGTGGPTSKLVKGGLEAAIYAAGSVAADKAAKALTPSFVKGLAAVTGNTEKMKQRAPSLYGASGPDLTRDIAQGIVGRDAQQNFYQRVLNAKPKPAATKTPEKKPEVQQVVTKKKVVPPVKQPEKPKVDPRLQRYRELIRQGKHDTARDLGMRIHADKYGTPSPKTKSRNIA